LLAHVTLASGAEETNSQTLKPADTNAPSLAVSNAPTPRVEDTNAPVLTTIDTNAFVPGAVETNPVILRDARGPGRLDLESFRLIWERNIFDPNRSPFNRFTRSAAPPSRDRERRRTDSFALIGTMSYEKGRFAFFEGSSPQYQKVLETSNSIGDYTITAITPSHVLLQSTNGQIELPVGMQMRREDEGPWSLAERAQSSEGRRSSDSSSGPVSSGDASEALRRLMERREKEGAAEATNTSEAPPISEPKAEPADSPEKTNAPAPAGADEVLKRLLEKREQEVNK
jgi:hypothetical protein